MPLRKACERIDMDETDVSELIGQALGILFVAFFLGLCVGVCAFMIYLPFMLWG